MGRGRKQTSHLAGLAATVLIAPGLVVAPALLAGPSSPAAVASTLLSTAGSVSALTIDFSTPPAPVPAQSPSGRPVVLLNAWDYPMIPELRAQHPGALVLVYKDLSSSRSTACQNGVDQAELPTGVGFCWAMRYHPEWFLRDSSGALLQERGQDGQYEMDYGNPAYQQQWLANVEADVKAHGWDGVFMDNALTTADAYGVSPTYPTDAAVQAAMRSMLALVGPALSQQGILTVANIGYATEFPGLWDDWVSLVSGAMQEYYLCWGQTQTSDFCEGGPAWSDYQHEITDAASMGKLVLVHSGDYAIESDSRAFDYSFASYLLANSGQSSYSFAGAEEWRPQYGWQLGQPWGPYYQVGGQALYKRDFAAGTALVNTGSTPLLVNLNATYLSESGSPVTSVVVQPVSGVVLRATAASPSGPPPAVSVQAVPDGFVGFHGSMGGHPLNAPIVGMAATPDGQGYWEVASDGGIFAFGDAGFFGSMGGTLLNAPIVGMAATPDGQGYWEVASDGGIFAFGDAGFFGSMGGHPLDAPIVGMASTDDGAGYWEVGADGGIFSFGDAGFYGSTGGMALDRPIVGMAALPAGQGYWEVASDGGIFSFGDAGFYGSTGGMALNAPVVGMAPGPHGLGYWEVASDGGLFCE
jgi:hypothetical protein